MVFIVMKVDIFTHFFIHNRKWYRTQHFLYYFLLWTKKWIKMSTFITIRIIFAVVFLFLLQILLKMGTLVTTQNLFIAIFLVKLNHSHRKYSRKSFTGGYSWSVSQTLGNLPFWVRKDANSVITLFANLDAETLCVPPFDVSLISLDTTHILPFYLLSNMNSHKNFKLFFSTGVPPYKMATCEMIPEDQAKAQEKSLNNFFRFQFWTLFVFASKHSDKCSKRVINPDWTSLVSGLLVVWPRHDLVQLWLTLGDLAKLRSQARIEVKLLVLTVTWSSPTMP